MNQFIQALKLAQQGQWDEAHELVQKNSDPTSCWIHAYLHRVEGDEGNASYWYRQAGKPFPQISVEAEWNEIYEELNS